LSFKNTCLKYPEQAPDSHHTFVHFIFIPPENGMSVLGEFHVKNPTDIRGGVRKSGKDTAGGMRADVQN
jgi:hypothetical protein